MILRQTPACLVLINQHDHAQVAGVLAAHWHPAYIPDLAGWSQVVEAVRDHDRGWIPLDQQLAWDAAQKPFSFIDYPLAPKLAAYKKGIDEVAQSNAYGALLGSLHYTTFHEMDTTPEGRAFKEREAARQQQLKKAFKINTPAAEERLHFHLQLLKFCDGLSIYLCINEPGVGKMQEHPWYREGLPYADFAFTQGKGIQAAWRDTGTVQVSPFPFSQAFSVSIPYRQVNPEQVRRLGEAQALSQVPYQEYPVQLVP